MKKHFILPLLISTLAVGLTGCCCCSGDSGAPSQGSMDVESKLLCRQAVRANLKAPSTADIVEENSGIMLDQQYTKRYGVEGYVDSENSFGARLRTNYQCVVNYDVKTDQYSLYSFKFIN